MQDAQDGMLDGMQIPAAKEPKGNELEHFFESAKVIIAQCPEIFQQFT